MPARGVIACTLVTSLVATTFGVFAPRVPAAHALPSTTEVVALVVEGVGYGHGRGLSQWGAYGRAVNGGQTWTQILDAYYGGTTLGSAATSTRTRVRLASHDGATHLGVVSTTRRAMWNATGYYALQARETGSNRYDIYAAARRQCPSTSSGWTRIAAGVTGPISFTTSIDELAAAPGDVLGVCSANGSVVHYRGTVQLTRDSAGRRRVVNNVNIEAYLRAVISREVSTSWGDAGSGRGMNALRAQAVAARSYAITQNRYAGQGGYATTCDTSACQVYGGAARRASATAPLGPSVTCEGTNESYECANTNRAIAQTAGRIRVDGNGRRVSTEYSASNGPQTAGGTFPSISDPWDDVPSNPNHRWTRVIDADVLESAYGLGSLVGARSEADPNRPFVGVWDQRVRLIGTNASAIVPNLTLRSAFGFPSHGFVVRAVTRGVVTSNSMRFIGDSVGRSISESATAELPALLDGMFATATYDAVPNRCTAGCGLSGVGAAASVPSGTELVLVELGYNAPTSDFGARIDSMMGALRARQVERVVWINLSERSGRADYVAANRALGAARSRWPELHVIDWRTYSAGGGNRARWFASDGIHLTATGQAEMARFVRVRLAPLADFPVGSSLFTWDRATGNLAVWSVGRLEFRRRSAARWSTVFDKVTAGDFDRDGEIDDLFVWSRRRGTYGMQSAINYLPWYRARGTVPIGFDEAIAGDFDGDGYVNDLFFWDIHAGRFAVYSFHNFVPTRRARGQWHRAFDVMVVGDFDDDGRLNDMIVWNRDAGGYGARTWSGFSSVLRSRGRFPPGYDLAVPGDWNADGSRDDLLLFDWTTGRTLAYTFSAMRANYRGVATFGGGYEIATAADLDDDGRLNELLLYDWHAGAWAIHRYRGHVPTRLATGTLPAGYDVIAEGEFG